MFHTLTSVGRKKLSVCQKNVAPSSCCSKITKLFDINFILALKFYSISILKEMVLIIKVEPI